MTPSTPTRRAMRLPLRVRLHWIRPDLLCRLRGHDPHPTEDGTWCDRCDDPLDERARWWDACEAERQRQRDEAPR